METLLVLAGFVSGVGITFEIISNAQRELEEEEAEDDEEE